MHSSRRREDLSLIISDVTQGDNVVGEDLLDLVMSVAWRSISERRVVKYESRRSVRVTGGFVMRGVEFRSHMNLRWWILLRRRYVNVVAGEGGLGMIFMLESIGRWSEVTMTEELMIGFRVELTCVMRRSRV